MRLRQITLQDFRNIPLARLEFRGRQSFLLGPNGQGKTNLLEAAGFITALRSFRTREPRLLVGHGSREAAIRCEVEHEVHGAVELLIKLRAQAREGRELWRDGERVPRLAGHLGAFPTVVFSSQDMALLRGAPALRRRWLDLTLSAIDADYLGFLQSYHRALANRNSLLKRGAGGATDGELAAFERAMAPAAAQIVERRRVGLAALGERLRVASERLGGAANEGREAALRYAPNFDPGAGAAHTAPRGQAADQGAVQPAAVSGEGSTGAATSAPALAAAWVERWARGRERDRQFRSTLSGPHRDDFEFLHGGLAASDYASEGQQRGLVLALRLAQAAWFRERTGLRPVLLADDVLGELDPVRRQLFWEAVDPDSQMIATGTAPPDAALGEWQLFRVNQGEFMEASLPQPQAPVAHLEALRTPVRATEERAGAQSAVGAVGNQEVLP
ncbi:DNA replication/repair protein RecF [Cephaloticoccus primus]|uniref:DNA replication/repair protein RecF n=1 Tax=Cephaloticoccus primus TaxID=1548207 RepID=UPI00083999C4|nr:DNA replication and repair protein RecF [Cephaloticoccus primus]